MLTAVTFVFHGTAVGTLLGDAVSLRSRGVDLAAALGTVGLGVAAITDVAYLNIRERAGEFAILRAAGWSGPAMLALVTFEGVGIGVWGAVCGAAAGLGLAAFLAGGVTGPLLLVAVAVWRDPDRRPGHRRAGRPAHPRPVGAPAHRGVTRAAGLERLRIRWERRDDIHDAFVSLTCIITFRYVIRLW